MSSAPPQYPEPRTAREKLIDLIFDKLRRHDQEIQDLRREIERLK